MPAAPLATTRATAPAPATTGVAFAASFSTAVARRHAAGVPLFLRPSLPVTHPDEASEQEADRVAERVLRMPVPAARSVVHRTCAACAAGGSSCRGCEEEPAAGVSRMAQASTAGAAPASVSAVLRAPGEPLASSARAFFEPRFGEDLSHVRVHTDREAQQSARDVNALAYAVGAHLVFGAGRYAPSTPDGQRLLAHELTHVLQSGQGGSAVLARQTVEWHPGVAHHHTPTGRWADVQAEAAAACGALVASSAAGGPTVGGVIDAGIACACASLSPADVLGLARRTVLSDSPLGQAHLDHYLTGGGVNMAEDLDDVIRRDSGVRTVLAAAITSSPAGSVMISQADYAVDDFRNAFGAIDRMDYEVDAAAGTVHVWFQDRYEWHPAGYGYSRLPGDGVRGTNCVHAAAVEMQSSGAADYWMFGNATVPLSLITGATGAGSGSGTTL